MYIGYNTSDCVDDCVVICTVAYLLCSMAGKEDCMNLIDVSHTTSVHMAISYTCLCMQLPSKQAITGRSKDGTVFPLTVKFTDVSQNLSVGDLYSPTDTASTNPLDEVAMCTCIYVL